MARCFSCGNELPDSIRFTRSEICPNCRADVRVCKNCRFYAPGEHWDCHETIPEAVQDKERANFCDYFKPAPTSAQAYVDQQHRRKEQARDALSKLFDVPPDGPEA